MRTPTDSYSSVRNHNSVDDVDVREHEENEPLALTSVIHYLRTPAWHAHVCEIYDRAAERLLEGSPWAMASMVVEEEEDPFPPTPGKARQFEQDDPFPLLRPSSRPPPANADLTRRERALRRKRAATIAAIIAAIIVAPFLLLATYALVS